jgi:hypothetical protein
MEKERELGVLINIGHLSPMILRKAIVESLEESADLVFIHLSPMKDYDCFAEIEG